MKEWMKILMVLAVVLGVYHPRVASADDFGDLLKGLEQTPPPAAQTPPPAAQAPAAVPSAPKPAVSQPANTSMAAPAVQLGGAALNATATPFVVGNSPFVSSGTGSFGGGQMGHYLSHNHTWLSVGLYIPVALNVVTGSAYAETGNGVDGDMGYGLVVRMRTLIAPWARVAFTFTPQKVFDTRLLGGQVQFGALWNAGNHVELLLGVHMQFRSQQAVANLPDPKTGVVLPTVKNGNVADYGAVGAMAIRFGRISFELAVIGSSVEALDPHTAQSVRSPAVALQTGPTFNFTGL